MKQRAKARQGSAGFTLVELLVALVLLGLISAGLFGGLRFGARVWESGSSQGQAVDGVQTVQGFLRRSLARARTARDDARGFQGKQDHLRFVAPLAGHVGLGGLYVLDLAVERSEAGARLMLEWRAVGKEEPSDGALSGRRILLTGASRVRFAYYGGQDLGNAGWQEAWDENRRLPELVRVDVGFPAGDGRDWPTLVVAPKVRQALR